MLAVLRGEAAAYLGVPSPNRASVLGAVIGLAALYRGRNAGLVVAAMTLPIRTRS